MVKGLTGKKLKSLEHDADGMMERNDNNNDTDIRRA